MNSNNKKNHTSPQAVLFKSRERFLAFKDKLSEYGVRTTILDFETHEWIEFDYSKIDFIIYYPSFKYSSNHPLALHDVYDNIMFIQSEYPHLKFYPDPNIIKYYNDKYRQFLFLKKHNYPIPETIPLLSEASLDVAEKRLKYPMVVKNRYGAGGGSVFRVFNRKELEKYYKLATLDLLNIGSARYFLKMLSKKIFYYHLIKEKKSPYPFLSPPVLAQKFVKIDRDLKTVTDNNKVVEGHWRLQADQDMWKMNIDGGGTGVWSAIPQEARELSIRLANDLQASWLNIDLILSNDKFLITEFSPVWHHYAYKEKESFIYKDDYNLDPLEVSLDLERIIVESLINAVKREK
jgi:hypothetical protein